jgi:hypothetical protein
MAALVSSRRRYPSYWIRSAAVSRSRSIVAAPTAARIWRMDLRTASRKARLAFFIKCQRSATLARLWQRLSCSHGVATAAVTGDNANLRLAGEPGLGRRWLPVGKQCDDLASLQVADGRRAAGYRCSLAASASGRNSLLGARLEQAQDGGRYHRGERFAAPMAPGRPGQNARRRSAGGTAPRRSGIGAPRRPAEQACPPSIDPPSAADTGCESAPISFHSPDTRSLRLKGAP